MKPVTDCSSLSGDKSITANQRQTRFMFCTPEGDHCRLKIGQEGVQKMVKKKESGKAEKTLKPVFHWKARSCWLPNANKIDTNNMKCTCPTPAPRIGDPMSPIFHLLVLGVGVGGNANFSVFRYQHGWYPQCRIVVLGV